MAANSLKKPPVILAKSAKPTHAVVILHGLGDTAQGWTDVARRWATVFPSTRFILPTAPVMPVSLNNGMRMNAWYDIKGLKRSDEECEGIDSSRETVESIVKDQVDQGIPHDRIIIGGFSQGGALSIATGLQMPHTLGGVLVMSGYLARPKAFVMTEQAKHTPVLHCHGESDSVVRFSWAEEARDALIGHGLKNLIFKSYPDLDHSLSEEEYEDITQWLKERMTSPSEAEKKAQDL